MAKPKRKRNRNRSIIVAVLCMKRGWLKRILAARKTRQAEQWVSSDDRVLWRLPANFLTGPMKRVTVGDVEKTVEKALEFISRVAGKDTTSLPKLSTVALKDHNVVRKLMEIELTGSFIGKKDEQALEYLIKPEREAVVFVASAVLKEVHDEFKSSHGHDVLVSLEGTIVEFQLWLEYLTDACVRIILETEGDAA